jgi:hypothetical protein
MTASSANLSGYNFFQSFRERIGFSKITSSALAARFGSGGPS